jgi:hypothetical protein
VVGGGLAGSAVGTGAGAAAGWLEGAAVEAYRQLRSLP